MEQLIDFGASGTSSCLDGPRNTSADAVEKLNPLTLPGWDAAVKAGGGHTVFFSREWAAVLARTYSYSPVYFALWNEGGLSALLPVMEVRSWVTGKRGVSLPFSDVCEPLAEDSKEFQRLFSSACVEGRLRGWRHLEIRGGQEFLPDVPPFLSYFEHIVPLSNTQGLFEELKPEVRTAIRRAEREGVCVTVERTLCTMEAFYGLHCQVRRKHGVPPQPLEFFQSVWKELIHRGMGSVLVARKGSEVIAAAVFFQWEGKVLYKFGASDRRFQQLRPNNLLFWTAIKHFGDSGFASMSLGRTSAEDAGLRRFKQAWGAREELVHYFRYDLKRDGFVTGRESGRGWRRRMFQLLPVPVSRLLGKLCYRHMG